METLSRFLRFPAESFFLFGPRGTGKTTLLRERLGQAVWLDLLDPERERVLAADPSRLRALVGANPTARHIVIDEVQRVPALLPVVHQLIEERSCPPFVLTGSSSRKLRRTGSDLLGGRAALKALHPFMAAEMGSRFRLEDALANGMLPVVLGAADPAETLRAYAALYVREEVIAEGLVRNLGAFARFLEAAALSHAQVLNVSNVARECSVERKSVEGYLSILEDLRLAFRLPPFTRRAVRATVAHPRFYLADAGVFRSLRPVGPLDRPEERQGQALEGLVAQHLLAWADYREEDWRLYYWRTRGGSEVDFVLYGAGGVYAIEVKNARRVDRGDLRGLRVFREDYPEARSLCLYRGADRLLLDGVLCLPAEAFLRELRPDRAAPWDPA